MGKCKTKAIQTDLGTFRHNQAYSKPCVNLAYSEPWYIQNPDIFKTINIFRILVYSEPRCTENSGTFKTQGLFRHLRWSVLWKQLTENSFAILARGIFYFMKWISWDSYSSDSYSMWKKLCTRCRGPWNFDTPINILN